MATTIERPGTAAPVVSVPDRFNIADYLVDRHVREGRGSRTAIDFDEPYIVRPSFQTQ